MLLNPALGINSKTGEGSVVCFTSGSAWNRGSRPQDPAGAGGDHRRPSRPPHQGDEAGPAQPSDDDDDWVPDFIEDMFDNSDRHAVGMGLLERLFGGSKRSEEAKKERTK